MRALFALVFLAACSERQEPVVLEHPSPEPSAFLVERRCPDPNTEFDTYVAPDGRIYGECKPKTDQ